jgi:hypothetical protein
VLACRVFQPELEALGVPPEKASFLEQGLHRSPDVLRREVAAALAGLERDPEVETVILVYGYCGGGLEGLTPRRVRLVAPAAHDCIPLLLGREPEPVQDGDGTFYLSAGWVDHGRTPLTEFRETARRHGEETARWVGRELLQAYRRTALITHPATFRPRHRHHAREVARLYDLELAETPGDLSWLARLLTGRPGPGVLEARPGRPLTLSRYPGFPDPAGKKT